MEDGRNNDKEPGDDDTLLGEALGRFGEFKEKPRADEGLLGEPMGAVSGVDSAPGGGVPLIAPPKRSAGSGNVRVSQGAGRGSGLGLAAVCGGMGAIIAVVVVKWLVLPGTVVELTERVRIVESELAQKKPPGTVAETVPAADTGAGEDLLADVAGGQRAELEEQLGVLKVRNRLTDLADRAIVLGERKAYQQLKAGLSDDLHANARTAVRSELLRVEFFYSSSSRLKGYVLPVEAMYPGEGIEGEAGLSTERVIEILKNREQPWKARARAAWLLGGRESEEATGALVEAMLAEVNLDVMKECQYSFEERTGFKAEALFDTLGVETWWEGLQAGADPDQ